MNEILAQFAINMIITMIRSMMDNGLVDQVQEFVVAAFDFDMQGAEKKAAVLAELSDIGGVFGAALASTAPWLMNMLIEALVGKHKLENPPA